MADQLAESREATALLGGRRAAPGDDLERIIGRVTERVRRHPPTRRGWSSRPLVVHWKHMNNSSRRPGTLAWRLLVAVAALGLSASCGDDRTPASNGEPSDADAPANSCTAADDCPDDDLCDGGQVCEDGQCAADPDATRVDCDDQDPCTVDTCDRATGECTHTPVETACCSADDECRDDDPCTLTSCVDGACVSSRVACDAGGPCEGEGVCDPATGACTYPPAADGAPCDDGDACTQDSRCFGGACEGGEPVECPDGGPCTVAGTCDPATGECTAPAPADEGAECDPGEPCQTGACDAGTCVVTGPVVCPESDDPCVSAATCDPETGACAEPIPVEDGAACDDGDACTQGDACKAGVCGSGSSVVCTATGPCREVGA